MPQQVDAAGDELVFLRDSRSARRIRAGGWFAVASLLCALSLNVGIPRVLWLLAAAAGAAGAVALGTVRGLTFDRRQGSVVAWRRRFGRKSETRGALSSFDALQVTTWRSRERNHYALALQGRETTFSLDDIAPPEREAAVAELAKYLKLPVVVRDRAT